MRPSPPAALRYGVAVLIVAVVLPPIFLTTIGKGLTSLVLVGVVVSAWYGGLGPGLLTTALMSGGIIGVLVAFRVRFESYLLISQALFVAEGTLTTLLVEALHRARRRAEAASHAKDRFLAVLSHELRTPLTPALAIVSALLEDPETSAEARPALESARRNIELEARLIDDLLDLTRIGRGSMTLNLEVADVHDLIRHAATICAADLGAAGVSLELNLAATHHHAEVDPARLEQVVWNLLKNAAKFTPAGGVVRVSTADVDGPDGPQLAIEVADTGAGMTAEELGRVFVPFEQGAAGRRAGGLGLGLAIARWAAEAHGGRLTAASPGPGQGTTFRLELAAQAGRPATLSAPTSEPGPPAGRRILLVEDHADTRVILARMLERRGHAVATAADLASARAAWAAEPFDVVLCDVTLPDGSGLDLVRDLRRGGPVLAVALSGLGAEDDRLRSSEAGFAAHLTKPVDFAQLEATIRRVTAAL